jgi:uroporphyrin-III C-methyltransferase
VTVHLVGAGPGDPGLITARGLDLLRRAEVLVHDRLAGARLVAEAPAGCLLLDAGKAPGRQAMTQDEINAALVEHGQSGRLVVRLKGGDPFVFGRGAEEALTLARAGISCEVIPGITAGIGVPAALGIPVTHRDFAHGVTFVTGHTHDNGGPDWAALARTDTTLVIYMGMKRLPEITRALRDAGMAGETPAAAIQHGTTPHQRYVLATLATLAGAARDTELGSPALVVIGRVVGLAQQAGHAALERRRIA